MMSLKIDLIDKKIVDMLTVDGRMSCADIASGIGDISERSVRYRLQRLIDQKIIGVTAVVDPTQIGFPVIADVFVEAEPGRVTVLAQQIASYENVTYVACSTGEVDISIQLVARNNQELYKFVTDVLGKLPGIRRTTTSIVPLIVKDDSRWRIPDSLFATESD
jgi:Lrp/AsnC family transcriptional regulator, regulator for asnA, asnC and gidA